MRISVLILAFLLATTSTVQAQVEQAESSEKESDQAVESDKKVESSDAETAKSDEKVAKKAAEVAKAEAEKAAAESDEAKAVRIELLEQAKSYKFQSRVEGGESTDLKLIERSVLNWTNPIKEFKTKEKGNEFANAVLQSFKPVQSVCTPGVQNPDQELSFSVNGTEFLIAIKRVDGVKLPAHDGKLIYSIGNMQFCGGDAAKLKELISKLAE